MVPFPRVAGLALSLPRPLHPLCKHAHMTRGEGTNTQVCFVCPENSPLCAQLLHLFSTSSWDTVTCAPLHCVFFLDHTQSQLGRGAAPERWCQTLGEHASVWLCQARCPRQSALRHLLTGCTESRSLVSW